MILFQTKFLYLCNRFKSECKTSYISLLNFISLSYQPALVSLNLDFCYPAYADLAKGLEASCQNVFRHLGNNKCRGDCLPKK